MGARVPGQADVAVSAHAKHRERVIDPVPEVRMPAPVAPVARL